MSLSLTSVPDIVGVIGGGQLCRMMAEAAAPLGIEIIFLDPTPDAPANAVARDQIVGAFDDECVVEELINRSDFLTYDIELADPDLIEALDPSIPVHPHPATLRMIQDKLVQKNTLSEQDIPVPSYRSIDSPSDLKEARDQFGTPMMLKARKGGYDGRGNAVLEDVDQFEEIRESLPEPIMAEELLSFDRELSVIGVKGAEETDVYPVTETIHREEILRCTVTPARTSDPMRKQAKKVARTVLDVLDGRGVYGIELFEHNDQILVNEIAPRPHNSGHWTIEGAHTSQFEQHLRAVTGRPLGDTDLRSPSVTVNILGEDGERPVELNGVDALLDAGRTKLHWYGKKQERPLRKMGHFTLTGTDPESLIKSADQLQREFTFQP